MDSVSTWLHKTAAEEGERNNEPFTSPKENEEMKLQQSNKSGIQADWSWETPDLSKDGDWYKERIRSLKAAVADLPKVPNLYEEGLEILKIHRRNYGVDGASELQLIWWEFPRESWGAIHEGSSMNFLITPGGALQPNAPMTEEEREVAYKFVGKLIRLRVLVPASEELRGNRPLFCVEKPHEPGAFRCIANAKTGGQNACMGKDPVYLARSEDILPHLYEGGWSAVADASKHFHNLQTKEEERQYLGCVHPRDGSQ
jgi:hypothetical protein